MEPARQGLTWGVLLQTNKFCEACAETQMMDSGR